MVPTISRLPRANGAAVPRRDRDSINLRNVEKFLCNDCFQKKDSPTSRCEWPTYDRTTYLVFEQMAIAIINQKFAARFLLGEPTLRASDPGPVIQMALRATKTKKQSYFASFNFRTPAGAGTDPGL